MKVTLPPRPPALDSAVASCPNLASAGALFLAFVYFAVCLFTKSGKVPRTPGKKQRNAFYYLCGGAIFVSIALIAALSVVKFVTGEPSPIEVIKPVFILESIAVIAFGLSWLMKAGFFPFFKDA